MTSSQLNSETPQGASGMTICLSEKTRVIAHAARQYKAGYITISRYNDDTNKWRNVHIAKKSFEKIKESSCGLLDALTNRKTMQLRLTKKQFLMITKFQKYNKEELYFLSILHPKTEQDNLTDATEYTHSKTINLRLEEFEKLHVSYDQLYLVITTPQAEDSKQGHLEEYPTVKCFRWFIEKRGFRSHTVFLTREQCEANVQSFIQSDNDDEPMESSTYVIEPEQILRPSKLEITQRVFHCLLLEQIGYDMTDMIMMSPPAEVVRSTIEEKVTKDHVLKIVDEVSSMLNHKRLYFLSKIYDIFTYVGGIGKIEADIVKAVNPPFLKTERLIDFCFGLVMKKDPNTAVPQVCVQNLVHSRANDM